MNDPISIVRYTPDRKNDWDNFVEHSKNGTFLFKRDYMEYHADQFEDCSFLFLRGHKIIALLPGCVKGELYTSHAGLTYGGFILSEKAATIDLLEMIRIWLKHLIEKGIQRVVYKCIPHIYHKLPAEEDLYALFRMKAGLVVRNCSTTIDLRNPIPSSRLDRARKRAEKEHLTIVECDRVDSFWPIIVENRQRRHNVKPVHTKEEINRLQALFPKNIRSYSVTSDRGVVAGGVIYLDNGVIHLQYASASAIGEELYAGDFLYHYFIREYPKAMNFFDFGISNEQGGLFLNEGMVRHKEEFGGRAIAYDQYAIDLSHPNKLVDE